MPEAAVDPDFGSRPECVSFLAYDSPCFDGSLLFWNGAEDHIRISHVAPEDDHDERPRERHKLKERILGRNVQQNIHSISLSDEVTCLYQLYSVVWCFLANGDVFAFQDQTPFYKLGVTKQLTPDPVVQVLACQDRILLATKNGGVYLAGLSSSGVSFQLQLYQTYFEPSDSPTLLIEITTRREVWVCSVGSVHVLSSSDYSLGAESFELREVGRVPLSAGCCVSSGVWVARGDLAYLYLYHIHQRSLIQTYDLSKAACQVLTVHSSFGVSSLITISNLLVAGTTSGVIVCVPLPQLAPSSPSAVGPARAAIHGPTNRVRFLAKVAPRLTDAGGAGEVHRLAPLLLALGIGQREPPVSEVFKNATHVTLWRCCN